MSFSDRLGVASKAAAWHLLGSAIIAGMVAVVVFGLWYPHPYDKLAGGQDLFLLMLVVHLICGPALTMILFNPRKPRRELLVNIGLVILLQSAALVYGVVSVAQARPVFLAFEGDRFRVVSVADVDIESLPDARPEFRDFSYRGPRIIGVHLVQPSEPEYVNSIRAALQGLHPAYRPDRWIAYDEVRQGAANQARDLSLLRVRYPDKAALFDKTVEESNRKEGALGFYPVQAYKTSDWIVIVEREHGEVISFLPLDGW